MDELVESSRETFRRLAVFEIDPNELLLPESGPTNGKELLEAADLADEVFWRQVLPEIDYRTLLEQIDDEELREIFLFHHGPYDRLHDDAPFLPIAPRSPGVGFYPRDLTREAFVNYLKTHHQSVPQLESPYTIIERTNSHLTAIPYHKAYRDLVEYLSHLLKKASRNERDPHFRRFLACRAQDLLTDDYYMSDSLWARLLDNPLDLVIGPYEVYEDKLAGLKASYRAMVLERDFEESEKVRYLQHDLVSLSEKLEAELGKRLHVEETRFNLSVFDLRYSGGDARKAIPPIAFSLPNDERVIENIGARQVILKNILEAKFRLVGLRILSRVLQSPPEDQSIASRSFFDHTLMHEIAHAIGPHSLTINGETTTVNRRLQQYYSVLEETKADVLGACLMLLDASGDLDEHAFLDTYIGMFLRSVRFGLTNAHGKANAIQFNYLLRQGALAVNAEKGKLSVHYPRARRTLVDLASIIIDIQERGDFFAAQRFVETFSLITPEIQELISRVSDLPNDIRLLYKAWS